MRPWLVMFVARAALATLVAMAGAGEPFPFGNESVIGRLYGVPAGDFASPAPLPGWQAGAGLAIANTSYARTRGARELVFDGETWVARLHLRHVWRNGWRLALQVPVVSHQVGGTDHFIEDYHDALGLPAGNRKRRPADRLEYRHWRDGETSFSRTGCTTGLGDIRLAVMAPLWRDRNRTRAVDAVAGVEAPTGDSDRLLGSGSWDVSLGLAAGDFASLAKWNLEFHGSAGILTLTKGEVLAEWQESVAGYGSVSVGWRLASWLEPRLQLDVHSPLFADTGFAPLDDWAVALACGATVRLSAHLALDLAVAEDVAVNTAPDVVLYVGLKRSL